MDDLGDLIVAEQMIAVQGVEHAVFDPGGIVTVIVNSDAVEVFGGI